LADLFIGSNIEKYIIVDKIDSGRVGKVYLAHREDITDDKAIKFIKKNDLRPNWEREITKVIKLARVPGVVEYFRHDWITINGEVIDVNNFFPSTTIKIPE